MDRILAAGSKIIGFQFKRPESEGPPWRWKLRPGQHDKVAESRWIWHCLPDFVDLTLQSVALYHCRFNSGNVSDAEYITGRDRFHRWGWLATSLMACQAGVQIDRQIGAEAAFAQIAENSQDAYLSLDRLGRQAYVIARGRLAEAELESEPA